MITQVRKNSRLYYCDVQKKIKDTYEKDVSYSYVRNLCERNGVSVKKVNCKGPDSHLKDDDVLQMILEHVQEIHDTGIFVEKTVPRANLVCLDYITNTIYNRSDRSLQIKGKCGVQFQQLMKKKMQAKNP